MKSDMLFFFITIIIFNMPDASGVVQLKRKITHMGTSFVRVQKYTNITTIDNELDETEELGLDILLISDYSLYQGFVDITKGDTASAQHYVSNYLTALFDQMKGIYENTPIFKKTFKLHMAGTFVAIREEDCPILQLDNFLNREENSTRRNTTTESLFENDINNATEMSLTIPASLAIDKLAEWIRHYQSYLPKHDHAVLLTKFDLVSGFGDSTTQGMAYVGEICIHGASSSVVEDVGGAATALIAAHEIGHSLGAHHDGSSFALECDTRDNFLMASTVTASEDDLSFRNSRRMSPCSVNAIEQRLWNSNSACIRKKKILDKSVVETKKAGEIFTLHQQCQIAFGPHYGVCSDPNYFRGKSSCRRLWCKNRLEKRSDPCETKTYFPAFDGSSCGRNKWCIGGDCVINEKKIMNCRDLNAKTCSRYSKSKLRHYCKSKDFKDICCDSCSKLKPIDGEEEL